MPARILVVEASRELRALITDVLAADGHEVKVVASGAEAIVLTEWPAFDLILGDLTMPAIEGAHLYWEIASRWPHLVARVICVTDGDNAGVSDHAILRAAAVPFLVKPFLPHVLQDLVRRRLDELGTRPSAPCRGLRTCGAVDLCFLCEPGRVATTAQRLRATARGPGPLGHSARRTRLAPPTGPPCSPRYHLPNASADERTPSP